MVKAWARKHICITHRHRQQCGDGWREGGRVGRGWNWAKGEKFVIVSKIKQKQSIKKTLKIQLLVSKIIVQLLNRSYIGKTCCNTWRGKGRINMINGTVEIFFPQLYLLTVLNSVLFNIKFHLSCFRFLQGK